MGRNFVPCTSSGGQASVEDWSLGVTPYPPKHLDKTLGWDISVSR